MSNTEQRLAANRANALRSTGPVTEQGKAIVSRNAIRHGLLSTKLLLEDEDAGAYEQLLAELAASLRPVGALECAIVERVGVTLWRQRRLVQSETARLALDRQPRKIASGTSSELGRAYGQEISADDLSAFEPDRLAWAQKAKSEIDALDAIELRTLPQTAPTVFEQLTSDAEGEEVETYLARYKDGLTGFVAELLRWCQEQLREAEARPQLLKLAQQVRAKRMVLPKDLLETFARYQTTLDNQLFKLLRGLREAQEWRLQTLDQTSPEASRADAEVFEQAA